MAFGRLRSRCEGPGLLARSLVAVVVAALLLRVSCGATVGDGLPRKEGPGPTLHATNTTAIGGDNEAGDAVTCEAAVVELLEWAHEVGVLEDNQRQAILSECRRRAATETQRACTPSLDMSPPE